MRLLSLLRTIAHVRQGRPGLPRFLTYIVTFTCNARCIMCDSWKKESPDDLQLDEIERIFRQLPRLDAVRLTGGEPFVRRDLSDIAALARTHLRPLFLHVTTNGFLTDRIVNFCETRDQSLPLRLLVSVDGLAGKHNEVRGRETAWDSAIATLKTLAPRQRKLKLKLAVNQTIVDAQGAEQAAELREFLRPLNIRHHVVMAYDASATYSLKKEVVLAPQEIGRFATFGGFSPAQIRQLLDDTEKHLAAFPLADRLARRYYLRGLRQRLLEGRGTPNPPCVALNAHLRLYPNGDVPVCQFNSRRVGNLRQETFEEVWFGKAIQPMRAWVRRCAGCWAECEVLPNALYSGDLFRLPGSEAVKRKLALEARHVVAPDVGHDREGARQPTPSRLAEEPRLAD